MGSLRRLGSVMMVGLLSAGLLVGCSDDGTSTDTSPVSETATSLGVAGFESLVAQDGVQIIDVRTPDEFATGHLAGATSLDVQSDFAAGIAGLDKNTTYALYCRSGVRSATARQMMLDAGFIRVVDLSGGILAWTQAGKPVVTG
ncbi:MAG: rhodanese-like domain-containing protein [Micrococcales bacterium]|nr:rhodanese-like domain-containing protein [Micrococcales bacterium]